MGKINPPVEIENENSRNSIQYILNIGQAEPKGYSDVSIKEIIIIFKSIERKTIL